MNNVGAFLTALVTASITMSAIILLILFLNNVLKYQVSAVFRYYVWLVALTGLLIPFRPNISIPFEPVQMPILFETSDTASGVVGEYIQNGEYPSFERQISSQEAPSISGDAPSFIEENPPIPYIHILFAIWGVGVLAVLRLHLRIYRKFVISVRRWGIEVESNQVLSVFQSILNHMRVNGKRLVVYSCAFVSSPMLAGFRNPTILLPEKEISADELEHIFKHELTHYRHRDLWMNLFVLLVSAMHWFNPFVHLMAKTIRMDCEAACDEAVVTGNDAEKRKEYGEAIIGFIGAKATMPPVLTTYFYGGSNSMKKRLSAIMDTRRKGKGVAIICVAMIVVATLLSGTVFSVSAASPSSQYLSEAKAKSIALEHAKLTESQVTFIKTHLDYDDGYIVYDVEFYSGNTEYDYEIDAVNGTIYDYDRDIEYYSIPSNPLATTDDGQYIGEARARSIALEHAKLAESQVTFIKTHLDYDDGYVVYDVEFYSGNTEYDYEIDAVNGTIYEYDHEIEYYAIPNNTTDSNNASGQSSQQAGAGQYIGEAKAKSLALSAAELSESQVSGMKVKLDREDGRMVYEVELDNGRIEYDYEIDAVSGAILSADVDYDD